MRETVIKAVSAFSDPGARPGQEDYVLVTAEKGIFSIADGFGGPGPGALAAKTACESVRGFLIKEAGDLEATLPFVLRSYFSLAGNVLFNALIHANRKLLVLNQGKNVHEKGGASLLAGYMDGDLLALANVGACTAWLFRNGVVTELVAPRTYGRLIDPFLSTRASGRDEARVPLMAVGLVDDLEPEILEYRIQTGDWLLLQTSDPGIAIREDLMTLQLQGLAPEDAANEAVALLGSGTYKENTSAVFVSF